MEPCYFKTQNSPHPAPDRQSSEAILALLTVIGRFLQTIITILKLLQNQFLADYGRKEARQRTNIRLVVIQRSENTIEARLHLRRRLEQRKSANVSMLQVYNLRNLSRMFRGLQLDLKLKRCHRLGIGKGID